MQPHWSAFAFLLNWLVREGDFCLAHFLERERRDVFTVQTRGGV